MTKIMTLTLVFLAVAQNRCTSFEENKETISLYNSVLDQIVTNNLYQRCLEDNSLVERKYLEYLSDSNKWIDYTKTLDSLIAIRKSHLPKCLIVYSREIGTLLGAAGLRASIKEALNDNFVKAFFGNHPTTLVIDSLSSPAEINLKQFKVPYLKIVEHNGDERPQAGVATIAFSRMVFDDDYQHAILYMEYNCGHQCLAGKLIFVERQSDVWVIQKIKSAWDT